MEAFFIFLLQKWLILCSILFHFDEGCGMGMGDCDCSVVSYDAIYPTLVQRFISVYNSHLRCLPPPFHGHSTPLCPITITLGGKPTPVTKSKRQYSRCLTSLKGHTSFKSPCSGRHPTWHADALQGPKKRSCKRNHLPAGACSFMCTDGIVEVQPFKVRWYELCLFSRVFQCLCSFFDVCNLLTCHF